MDYIKRDLDRKFLHMSSAFKAVMVVGARQVGKSTMLKHLAEKQERTVVTMDDDFARELASPLTPLTDQTAESCKREMNRILHVLRSGMLFLIRYLPTAAENCSVARWLATDRESAMQAFGHLYPGLVRSLYGDNPKHVYTLAACDLLDCGRIDETHALLSKAREEGKLDIDGMSILFAIEHSGDDKKGLSYFRDPGAAGGCFKG